MEIIDLLDHLGHLVYYEVWQRSVIKQTILIWQKLREKIRNMDVVNFLQKLLKPTETKMVISKLL